MTPIEHIPLPADAPQSVRRFVADLMAKAAKHGVPVSLSDSPQVPYSDGVLLVSGFFVDRPQARLAVAIGKPYEEWLPILVHEACHMDQWIEKSPAWLNVFVEGREAVDWIDEWVDRKIELSPERLADCVERARTVELDCEKRAVAAILAYDLPIDVPAYIQKANAYVLFYNHLAKVRRWSDPGNAPYENPDVWECAPKSLPVTGRVVPPELAAAYDKHYPSASPARPSF